MTYHRQYALPPNSGVPNPYGPRLHNWKGGPYNEGSLYHGPNYVRPMYTLPYMPRPLNGVGNTGADFQWEFDKVNTRGGSFARKGWGGGVFNQRVAFGGLGALPGPFKALPEACMKSPGFLRDWNGTIQSEALLKCNFCRDEKSHPQWEYFCGGYTSHANCMDRVKLDMAYNDSGAVNRYCPRDGFPEPAKWTGGSCTSDSAVKSVQWQIGTNPDGAWGPESQAAYDIVKAQNDTTWCDYLPGCTGNDLWGQPCAAPYVPPVTPVPPVAPPVAPPPPVIEPEPEPEEATTKTQSMNMGMFVVGGLMLAAGLAVALQKKK